MRPMYARSSYHYPKDKNNPRYKKYAERRKVYEDHYRNEKYNDRDNSTAASTQSSISNTVKRGYEETDQKPIINANTDIAISNAKRILESNVNTEGQLPLIVNSLLNIVTELSKKTTESQVVQKRHKPAQSKDPGSGTITFDGIPIYLIEEPCHEFRTASNGNEFQIILVETCQFGMQPVPKWKDDKRDFFHYTSKQGITTSHVVLLM